MSGPDDPRAQAGECDVAAIGARAAAATKARGVIAERFGENAAVIQHATDAVCASAADVPALLRHIAAEVAAAVAGETRRCIDACKHIASQCPVEDDRDLALTCAEAIEVDAPVAADAGVR